MSRIDDEVEHLRYLYPDLKYQPDGRWVRIPEYTLGPLRHGGRRRQNTAKGEQQDNPARSPVRVPTIERFHGRINPIRAHYGARAAACKACEPEHIERNRSVGGFYTYFGTNHEKCR
jgi:hypothetical protein